MAARTPRTPRTPPRKRRPRLVACPGRVLLVAYAWAATAVVPIAVFVLAQDRSIDAAAATMVSCMWVPSFILSNGMLAVFLAKVPGRAAAPGRCAAIGAATVAFHVLFTVGAVGRIDEAPADSAVQVLFVATVAAYVLALTLAIRAITAGEGAEAS